MILQEKYWKRNLCIPKQEKQIYLLNYDHAGRVLSHDISIDEAGGAKATTIRLTENEYNELSQVIEKKLHSTNNQTFLQNVDYKYNIRGWLTDINDIEFGTITATELQDQLVNGLVTQVTNGNIEIEMNVAELESGNRDRVEVTEGTEEEVLELEENPTTALVTALTDAINIGDLGTIDESNIDLALETLRTQLEAGLTSVGVTETLARGMIEDEVLGFYQNEWLRTVANDNDNDLFAMHFDYTLSNNLLNATGQFNGNISGMTWRVRGQNKKAYSLEYDNLNRLESADYIEIDDNNQIVTASQGGYDMAATYDLNGNIMTMNRKGAIATNNGLATAYGFIDAMTYTYAPNSNELQKIQEATVVPGSTPQILNSTGFKDNNPTSTTDYTYDENGNVTYDANKGVTTIYNHLNLPIRFEWSATKYIEITYDAAGVKLTKTKYLSGTTTIKHYVGGIEYNGNNLEAVYHAEGRATYDPTTSSNNEINGFGYEYSIKDHLGNSRVMFSDLNGNGQVTESEIIQAEHYYPFGMVRQEVV
jgi:hypothetical protein